jgi:N-acetylmuramoyl-L-alanine amidase
MPTPSRLIPLLIAAALALLTVILVLAWILLAQHRAPDPEEVAAPPPPALPAPEPPALPRVPVEQPADPLEAPPPEILAETPDEEEPEPPVETERVLRVIIDPGHGIGIAGNPSTNGQSKAGMTAPSGTPEYLMTWVLAEQVKEKIEELAPAVGVKLTKESAEENLPNLDRARQLGDYGGEIFVSLHFDGFSFRGGSPRKSHAIVLPERFQERIGGRIFRTNNRNQPEEIELAQKLVDAVVEALEIPGAEEPINGGVNFTGTGANKGVLFETTPDWIRNSGPNGELWEERLYHSEPDTKERGLAVILEIENMRNNDVDSWFNDEFASEPYPPRYLPLSEAIARVIVEELEARGTEVSK